MESTDLESKARQLKEKRRLGGAAAEFLADERFKDAVAAVRDNLHREWATSAPCDADKRERVYYQLQALTAVVSHLATAAKGALVAHHELAEVERKIEAAEKGKQ